VIVKSPRKVFLEFEADPEFEAEVAVMQADIDQFNGLQEIRYKEMVERFRQRMIGVKPEIPN
jgi:hypothetical protein